ncbi:MAG: DUF4249 family protein [bacterium]
MKKILIIFLPFVLFTGCQKEVNWPVPDSNLDLVIVDGILTDENKVQSVKIYYSVNQQNDTVRPVTSANVLISNEDSAWTLIEQPGKPGNYLAGHSFPALPGKNYTLHVFKDDKLYTAKASLVAGIEFEELKYTKNDSDDLYHLEWVADAFNADQPAMWEVLIDWSDVSGYENTDSLLCRARLKFYTLPTLDVSEIFAPEMESISFPAGTRITEKRYSLTEEHAAFLRAMLLETNWQGGLFGSAPANVITNLGGGAFGFFGVCSVNTLYITVTP